MSEESQTPGRGKGSFRVLVPWAVAACLALALAQAARLTLVLRSRNALLEDQANLADLELKSSRNQAEAERIIAARELSDTRTALAASNDRIDELGRFSRAQGDLARLRIATLVSMIEDSPRASAVLVWDPLGQKGLIEASRMPAPPKDKDYQVWLVDPEYAAPVSAGLLRIDPATGGGSALFKAAKPVRAPARFTVSIEPRGGSAEPQGPIAMISE
jgi:hypothetical protein